jgi:serine/threonine protein kinase
MQPERYQKIVNILARLPTSRGRSFFAGHGLGEAWSRPGKGWGRRERVNEALAEAERRGILAQVLDDAELQFGGTAEIGANGTRHFTGQAGIEWRADLDEPLGPPGGFGQVYAGQGPEGSDVAVKIVPLRFGDEAERRRRAREIEIATRLHEIDAAHLLVPIDYALEGKDLLIVMPRADAALSDRLTQLDEKGRRKALLDVALGLQELSQAGVLHRDLKPRNVLLRDNVWQLADFGISRDTAQSTATFTFRGFGTLAYMAPELWQQQPATVKTDLYAYGCLAYEVLTGQQPFLGPDQEAFREQHLRKSPPPLTDVEPGLARLVLRLLEKDPANRPQDARAVAEELERLDTPLNERQERLRRAAQVVDQMRAEREADQRSQLASLELAEVQRRQALSDLNAVMQNVWDFIKDALPDATVTGANATWQVRLLQARLSIKAWTQPPKPADSSDHIVLAGEIRGISSRGTDLGLLGNIVCEEEAGRLEWRLYRFTANPIYGGDYRFGPRNRPHGLTASSFASERIHMVHPLIHVWQLQRTLLNADAFADLLEEALRRQPGQ